MKFKDDFKTQASIAWAIKHAMVLYPGYQKLLEASLPEMADKGQAESLRIKLRILLEMLGEPTDNWISVNDRLPDFGENVLVAYMPSSPIMERWGYMVTKRVNAPKGTIYARMMDDNNFRIDGVVTHYQPLPSTPKTK